MIGLEFAARSTAPSLQPSNCLGVRITVTPRIGHRSESTALRWAGWAIILIGLAILSSCGDDNNPVDGKPPGDTIPPTVLATTPVDGDSTVSVNTVVSARFSEPMDPATMVAATIELTPATAGQVSYGDSSLVFAPDQALDTNQVYVVTITTAARDTAGNALAADHVWHFATYRDTTPPTVVSVSPADGDSTVLPSTAIRATFTEKLDPATVTAASFYLTPAVDASIQYSGVTATLVPLQPLDTLNSYIATITTAVTDSSGNHLPADYSWEFFVIADTESPTAVLLQPADGSVVGDSTSVIVEAHDNDRVERIEFYVDGVHVDGADDYTEPYTYLWSLAGFDTASTHTVFARAYDPRGNVALSDTATVYYQWRPLIADPNEPIARNLKAVYERSTANQVQFRVETYNGWGTYKAAVGGINVALFFDTDQNPATGQTTVKQGTIPINDIGAEYRIVIGLYGDSVGRWNGSTWVDHGEVENLNIRNNSNVFEVSISTSRIGSPLLLDLVVANVNLDSVQYYGIEKWDWAPDQGHATVYIDRSFGAAAPASPRPAETSATRRESVGPFD